MASSEKNLSTKPLNNSFCTSWGVVIRLDTLVMVLSACSKNGSGPSSAFGFRSQYDCLDCLAVTPIRSIMASFTVRYGVSFPGEISLKAVNSLALPTLYLPFMWGRGEGKGLVTLASTSCPDYVITITSC